MHWVISPVNHRVSWLTLPKYGQEQEEEKNKFLVNLNVLFVVVNQFQYTAVIKKNDISFCMLSLLQAETHLTRLIILREGPIFSLL